MQELSLTEIGQNALRFREEQPNSAPFGGSVTLTGDSIKQKARRNQGAGKDRAQAG